MTAEQRAGLSDAALAMTQPCIDELIKDISRRVQKAGAITDTAEYQIYRAQALGEGKKAIEQAVSKQIGISEEVIASLFEYVADKSLSPDENGSLKRMTEAYTRMTQSKTRELLRDLWADTPEGKVQPLQTAYARAMDFAFRQVATGTLDLNTAIRRAVTPLAKRGLLTIEQKSGRSVGIEYACRRYIMDQLGQLDDEIQHADHDALGCDGWEISAHAACAPDHEGFTWKVSCENAGKELCADLIDGIVADAGNIEFDWIVGAAPMAYKGTMHFAVCAVRVDAAGNILQEWHSMLGAGDVANGIEATVQNIGGQDLLAHIQSITAAAQQNAAATQRDAAAAAKSAKDAATSEGNAAASAKKAQDVSDSLPADYTAMSSDVGTLKNQMQRAYPDNSTIGENPWSSKNIVDMLCPPIEESGNPVVCYPVAGYQLGVKAKWEPMQEGTGTPSPENIRPIKGLGSVTVTRCGENLLNFPQITTWTQITKTYEFKFKAGTYYLYCGNVVHGGSSAPAIAFSDATSKVASISLEQGMKKEIQLKKDCQFVILYTNGYDYYGSAGVTATVEDLMLVASNEIPSVYTPYIGQTNTLTLPETVYGGEVDAVTGEGQETWQILNNPSSYDYYEGAPEGGWSQSEDAVAWYLDNPTLFPYKTKVLSNIFNSVSDVVHTTKPYLIGSANHFIAFRLPRSVAATGNDVKNWLASNDVEIAFEPIDKTPFTATGAQPIPALAGANTVLTDADRATVTGRADLIKRITDLEDATASQT